MRILDGPMLAPNCCIICEQHPMDVSFIDTLVEFQSDVYHRMNGRKYVCASCMASMALVAGYEHSSKVREANEFLDQEREALIRVQQLLETQQGEVFNRYANLPTSAVFPQVLHLEANEIEASPFLVEDNLEGEVLDVIAEEAVAADEPVLADDGFEDQPLASYAEEDAAVVKVEIPEDTPLPKARRQNRSGAGPVGS